MSEAIVIDVERCRMGVALAISDGFARSMELEAYRDAATRSTVNQISAWFASRKVYEETRIVKQSLGWRDRFRVLLGKPVDVTVTVAMRRNCPHLSLPGDDNHIAFLTGGPR